MHEKTAAQQTRCYVSEFTNWRRSGRRISCVVLAQAAIAVAIVSTKPDTSFRSSPGAYFYGMIARTEQGELYLERNIFGRRERTYGPRRGQRHPKPGGARG